MRVLLVHERFPPDYRGGGEYVALETARGLQLAGHDVLVVCSGDPALTEHQGINTRRLSVHPYLLLTQVSAIAAAAREHRADIIQTFSYHAAVPSQLAARRLGCPVVCTILGLFGAEWRSLRGLPLGLAFEWVERVITCRPYDKTSFLSDFSRDIGLEKGVRPDRACVINPGVSLEHYAPAAAKENVALFVGKFESRKGVEDVLALAEAEPGMPVRMLGWGPAEAMIRSRGLANVEVLPFQQGRPLYDAFAKATLFLFPSRAETFGLVLVEAMASGCAVVSSIPLDYAGRFVEPGDRHGFIEAARTLWHDRELMASMGAENVERARYYSWERATVELVQLYETLLAEP